MNTGHQHRTQPLNAIGAGFVGRFAGGDVGINLCSGQGAEGYLGADDLNDFMLVLHQRDGGQNFMGLAGHGAQHAPGVGIIFGFHQNLIRQHAGSVAPNTTLPGFRAATARAFSSANRAT